MNAIPKNPYRWNGDRPKHRVSRRALLERVRDELLQGDSGYLVGCRGMGKTVFRRELQQRLKEVADLDVIVFDGAPEDNTLDGMLSQLTDALGDRLQEREAESKLVKDRLALLEVGRQRKSIQRIINAYLEASPDLERLILIYDELDAFDAKSGKNFFNGLEVVRKGSEGQLVVFAVGGVRMVAVDSVWGSSFFSRLIPHVLEPFTQDELIELAAPFEQQREQPLSDDMIDLLRLTSGGNGMLATYGLQMLWKEPEPKFGSIENALAEFRSKQERAFAHIKDPVFGRGDLSQATRKAWNALRETGGTIERDVLQRIVDDTEGEHAITPEWVLTMLRATGLIRCAHKAFTQQLVEVEIITSILTFDSSVPTTLNGSSLQDRLITDLSEILKLIHRGALDFTRAVEKSGNKRNTEPKRELVEESVYSGMISLGLQLRGWRTEREAQLAAGRTDLKARHLSFGEQDIVIEVKLWPRSYDVHQQIQDYWAEGVVALATVMISDTQKPTLKQDYLARCLDGKAEVIEELKPRSEAILGHFTASTTLHAVTKVDHFLLRLPVRRGSSKP